MDIPEEDEQGGENEPHPDVEQHQAPHRIEQTDKLPCEGDAVQGAEYKEDTQGQAKVDESLDIFEKRNRYLGTLTLEKMAALPMREVMPWLVDSLK